MLSFRLLLLGASSITFLVTAPALAQSKAQPTVPWAQGASDIPADSNVRFGVLPNGMQYAILRNATPPGQASFRLRIDAGSLMENETQLGLAHFMEHMAFNGTTNIPENDLLRILERHGLAFGADTNASTGFDQTVYMLELPRADEVIVDDALRIMREQVSEALMAPDAVDAERGVIEGEERLRNTPGLRSFKAQLALLAPGQRISQRLPIGDLNIIRNAPRERFVEFYNAYYRPSRATFVAVGDFDVDTMETKIRGAFESWQPKAEDGPEPDLGTVASRKAETKILVEPGVQSNIQLNWISNPARRPDTITKRRDELITNLGLAIINRRLGELTRIENPPFLAATSGSSDLFDSLHITSVSASFNPGAWSIALKTIDQEQRRLVQFGVSDAELQREITDYRTALENGVAGAATRRTPAIANTLVDTVNDGAVFNTPQVGLDLFDAATQDLTAAQVNEALEALFDGEDPSVLFITPVDVEGGEVAVNAALQASRQVPVTTPPRQAEVEWPYDRFGAAGTVVERRTIEEIGASVVVFSNGVRLTVKPTDFREDQILVNVHTGIGERALPTDQQLAISQGSGLFQIGGTLKLTADEIEKTLTGRIYSARLLIEGQSFVLSGVTRPADLNIEMQLLAAYLVEPAVRPEPFSQLKSTFWNFVDQNAATPEGAFDMVAPRLLASGDRRRGLPSVQEFDSWTNDQLKAQIIDGLASGPVDVVMVGDLTVDQAITSVASTFGALAPRGSDSPPAPGSDSLRFPAGITEPLKLIHNGPADQAMGFVGWPTSDQVGDRTEARRVSMLASVLQLRVLEEIREKQALAYSPAVGGSASRDYANYGLVSVSAQVEPHRLPAFYAAVDAIAASLREAPPTEDELNRARLPVIESLRRSHSTNTYWLDQLAEIAEKPGNVEQTLTQISDLEAVTPADIQALAERYLRPEKAWRASVISATPSE